MIPRKRLDIHWTDLFIGLGHCLWMGNPKSLEAKLEQLQPGGVASLICLSVRSGFDALLHTLNLEPGSEILVSAVTIRDMARIIEAHALVPIPIDLDFTDLTIRPELMAKAVTSRTKAILVAHLFGSRMPMEPILHFAQTHNLLVIEDCAQAYAGPEYWGHPQSDVSLFSFGPIKTATALAGGILHFRDPSLCQAVQQYQEQWPRQSRWLFFQRIMKYMLLVLLSERILYQLLIGVCQAFKLNHDRLISSSVRGFPGDNFFQRIRHRPNAAMLALLKWRLQSFDRTSILRRIQLAELAIKLMPALQRPGKQATQHTHWVFPILHDQPEQLMHYLWKRGFDATQGSSSLCVIEPPPDRPEMFPWEAQQTFPKLLYLPIYAGVSEQEIEQLAQAFQDYEAKR